MARPLSFSEAFGKRCIVVGKVIGGLIAVIVIGYLLLNFVGLLWLG